jgi:hypothetical protein
MTRFLAVSSALLAAFSAGACAPTLAGQLKGPDGGWVPNAEARVNISSLSTADDAPAPVVVEVDATGNFATKEPLAPGPYLVEALVPGYAPESKRVILGETDGLEIQLKALPKAKRMTIGVRADADDARGAGGATLTPPTL